MVDLPAPDKPVNQSSAGFWRVEPRARVFVTSKA